VQRLTRHLGRLHRRGKGFCCIGAIIKALVQRVQTDIDFGKPL